MGLFRSARKFALLFTALCSLITAIDGFMDEQTYGLIIARMPVLHEDWALTKRDVCSDALPGTKNAICTPGSTLCCVPNNTNSAFPQCQTILGSGYCCVSNTDCYVDTQSDCAASNSVPCTMLAAGVTKACCPPFTTCPSNFNQTDSLVRCNLNQAAASSSISTPSTSSTQSSSSASYSSTTTTSSGTTTSSSSTSTPSEASNTPNPLTQTSSSTSPTGTGLLVDETSSNSSSLSPGADAGIGIGVALAVLTMAGLAFWAYQRGKKRRAAARAGVEAAINAPMYSDSQNQYGIAPKIELPSLDTHNERHELGG